MNKVKVIKANLFLLFYALSFFAYVNVHALDLPDYKAMSKTLMYSFLFCWYIVKINKVNPLFIFVMLVFALSDLVNIYSSIDIKYIMSLFFLANTSLLYFVTRKICSVANIRTKVGNAIYITIVVFLLAFLAGLIFSNLSVLVLSFSSILLVLFCIALYYYRYEVKESSFLILASVGALIICYSFAALNLLVIQYSNYVIIHVIAYGLFLFMITKSIVLEDKQIIKITAEDRFFRNKNLSIIFFIVFSCIYTYLRIIDNTSFLMYLTKSFLIIIMFLYYTNLRSESYNYFFLILSVLHLVGGNVYVSTNQASFMQGVGFYFSVNLVLIYMILKRVGIITKKDLLNYFLPVFIVGTLFVYFVFGNTQEKLIIYTFTFTLSILIAISLKYFFNNKNKVSFYLFFSIQTLAACYIFAAWVRLVESSIVFNFFEAILYCLELYFLTAYFVADDRALKLKKGYKKQVDKVYVYEL